MESGERGTKRRGKKHPSRQARTGWSLGFLDRANTSTENEREEVGEAGQSQRRRRSNLHLGYALILFPRGNLRQDFCLWLLGTAVCRLRERLFGQELISRQTKWRPKPFGKNCFITRSLFDRVNRPWQQSFDLVSWAGCFELFCLHHFKVLFSLPVSSFTLRISWARQGTIA